MSPTSSNLRGVVYIPPLSSQVGVRAGIYTSTDPGPEKEILMPAKLQTEISDITEAFAKSPRKIYSNHAIDQLRKGRNLRIAQSQFLSYLLRHTELRQVNLEVGTDAAPLERYTWGDLSPYELALGWRPDSYLSHGTAAALHGLVDEPASIYSNREQSKKTPLSLSFTQEGIDKAFAREQRQSRQILTFKGRRIVMISGKYTGQFGVVTLRGPSEEQLRATNLERTLIDIVVRPMYAGGARAVLTAFRAAKGKASAKMLYDALQSLNHAYPYHQAVGFYMQRADYSPSEYEPFHALGTAFDFYLAHGIENPSHDVTWRIFYPPMLG